MNTAAQHTVVDPHFNMNGLQNFFSMLNGGLGLGGSTPAAPSPNTQHQQQQTQYQQPQQTAPNLFSILGLQQSGSSSAVTTNGAASGVGGPVGSCATDEDLLVNALRDSAAKGWTYKQAIESLHGVHNHGANEWKDYYLDQVQRINTLVSQRNGERSVAVAKKPVMESISRADSSSNVHKHSSSSPVKIKRERVSAVDRGRSSTANVKVKTERTDKGKGRDRASRTPSPPRNTVKRGNKYLFTDEDREWLVRYANYRLKEDHSLKKLDICAELTKKAPHHSASSWMTHWGQHREHYDSLIAFSQDHTREEESDTDKSSSSSEGEDDDENDSEYGNSDSGEETDAEADIKKMSASGESLNDADRRVIARYMASFGSSEWDNMSLTERWEPFARKYRQRNAKAWGQIAANHSKAIKELASKYRRRTVGSQKAVPSWARNQTPSAGVKRVRACGEEDGQQTPSKRTRDE